MGRKYSNYLRLLRKTDHVAPPPRENPPNARCPRDAAKASGVVFVACVRYLPSTAGMTSFVSSVGKAGKVDENRSLPRRMVGIATIVGEMRLSAIMWSRMFLAVVGLDCVPSHVRSFPCEPCMRYRML